MKYCRICGAKKAIEKTGMFDEATGKPMGRYICPKNRCHDGHEWVVKVHYGFWHMINQKVYVCARCGAKDLLR